MEKNSSMAYACDAAREHMMASLLDLLPTAVPPIETTNFTTNRLTRLYNSLIKLNFTPEQVELALQSSDRWNLQTAVDWLCITNSRENLPPTVLNLGDIGKDGQNSMYEVLAQYKWDPAKPVAITPPGVCPDSIQVQPAVPKPQPINQEKKPVEPVERPRVPVVSIDDESDEEEEQVATPKEADFLMTEFRKQLESCWRYAPDKVLAELPKLQGFLSRLQLYQENLPRRAPERAAVAKVLKQSSQLQKLKERATAQKEQQKQEVEKQDTWLTDLVKETEEQQKEKEKEKEETTEKIKGDDVEPVLGFDALEAAAALPSPVVEPENKEAAPHQLLEALHIVSKPDRQRWNANLPWEHLRRWCSDNDYLAPKIEGTNKSKKSAVRQYCVVTAGKGHRLGGTEWKFLSPIPCDSTFEAKNSAALLALYKLMSWHKKQTPIYKNLPPMYREAWLYWQRVEDEEEAKKNEHQNSRCSEFVNNVLTTYKPRSYNRQTTTTTANNFTSPPLEANPSDVPDNPNTPFPPPPAPTGTLSKGVDTDVDDWEQLLDGEGDDARIIQKPAVLSTEEDVLLQHSTKEFLSKVPPDILEQQKQLPIYQHRDEILQCLQNDKIVVICGETGSGKTTQVPQYILQQFVVEECVGTHCNIVCTQPRRISAMSVAERVAEEMGMGCGQADSLIGYQVRLQKITSKTTRLLFCTTGILLRQLQTGQQERLSELTHIIVDEVHERSMQSDFLLMLLRESVHHNPHLRIVLMSATINPHMFSAYFGSRGGTVPPIISVSGRTFPVTQFFTDDMTHILSNNYVEFETEDGEERIQRPSEINYFMMVDVVRWNLFHGDRGAILVFLPGMAEIQQLAELLQQERDIHHKMHVVFCHSMLAPAEQRQVFSHPPRNKIKVILSTNIAETSITIPDVTVVIDSGRMKELRYSSTNKLQCLATVWVSQAAAKQRMGRAGRVQSGTCYHMYSQKVWTEVLDEFPQPEMLRVPLQELCLQVTAMNLGNPVRVLRHAPDPPETLAVQRAIDELLSVGAVQVISATEQEREEKSPNSDRSLDEDLQLTPLGEHLARLPVDVMIGKLLLMGIVLQCIEPTLSIAAAMALKAPIMRESAKQKEAIRVNTDKLQFWTAASDWCTAEFLYRQWVEASLNGNGWSFVNSHNLSVKTLEMMRDTRSQLLQLLIDADLLPKHYQQDTVAAAIAPNRGKKSFYSPKSVPKDDRNGSVQFNRHSHNPDIVKTALTCALLPNVARVDGGRGSPARLYCGAGVSHQVYFHPSSINHGIAETSHGWPFVVYFEKIRTAKVYLRDSTVVSPFAVLLFGGDWNPHYVPDKRISVEGWVRFNIPPRICALLGQMRRWVTWAVETVVLSSAPDTTRYKRKAKSSAKEPISTAQWNALVDCIAFVARPDEG